LNHILPAWDLVTGQMAATGLLAAERHRARTGQGQHVKLALEDVALAVMGHLGFIAEAEAGVSRGRHGNDLYGAFGRDFCSADGARLMIVGLTRKQWSGLCAATGLGDEMARLAARQNLDFDAEGDRFQARQDIAALIGAWVASRGFAEIKAMFDAHGVCFSRYQTVRELVAHDPSCSAANPMFSRIEQPGVGGMLAAGPALDFSGLARVPASPAPALGQHTEAVLYELLGIGQAAYGRLKDRNIVANEDDAQRGRG
jgi:2-methylfumaryl-CoA isomerase